MPAVRLEHVSKRFRKLVLRTGYTTLKTALTQSLGARPAPAEYVQAAPAAVVGAYRESLAKQEADAP